MGYKSDVYLVMDKEDYEKIQHFNIFKYASKIRDFKLPDEPDNYTLIIWEYINWYNEENDIKELRNYLIKNFTGSYDYLYLGEYYDDTTIEDYLGILNFTRFTKVYLKNLNIDDIP